jgi:hypothetical protein
VETGSGLTVLRGTSLVVPKGNFVRCDKRCCAQEFQYDENNHTLIIQIYTLIILERIQTYIYINYVSVV